MIWIDVSAPGGCYIAYICDMMMNKVPPYENSENRPSSGVEVLTTKQQQGQQQQQQQQQGQQQQQPSSGVEVVRQ